MNFWNLSPNSLSKPKPSGFTLVEVLVAASLSVLLIGMAGSVYLQSERLTVSQADELSISQNARVLIDRLSRDVRQTTSFNQALPDQQSDGLILIDFVDGHDADAASPFYLRYDLTDGQLWRRRQYYYRPNQPTIQLPYDGLETIYEEGEEPNDSSLVRHETEATMIADSVADISFWGDADLLKIDVWLQSGGSEIYQLHSAVAKRN